ncbi:hypothetical protein EDC94DRAFT_658841 [Helicostylum pulchrum]|nr:hypothetical protein EDC94DRAFT_658841 [Helicostylum pulchrum]
MILKPCKYKQLDDLKTFFCTSWRNIITTVTKDPLTDKIAEDEGKLVRKGKDILDKSFQTVLLEKKTTRVTSWILQLSGLNGKILYFIQLTKSGIYVAVPQSPIQFPSKFASSTFTETFKFLLSICQSMNDLALEAQNTISYFNLNHDSTFKKVETTQKTF